MEHWGSTSNSWPMLLIYIGDDELREGCDRLERALATVK
jgi:hypothetical protein